MFRRYILQLQFAIVGLLFLFFLVCMLMVDSNTFSVDTWRLIIKVIKFCDRFFVTFFVVVVDFQQTTSGETKLQKKNFSMEIISKYTVCVEC